MNVIPIIFQRKNIAMKDTIIKPSIVRFTVK